MVNRLEKGGICVAGGGDGAVSAAALAGKVRLHNRLMRPLLARTHRLRHHPSYAKPWQPSTATCAATSMTRAWETLPETQDQRQSPARLQG